MSSRRRPDVGPLFTRCASIFSIFVPEPGRLRANRYVAYANVARRRPVFPLSTGRERLPINEAPEWMITTKMDDTLSK